MADQRILFFGDSHVAGVGDPCGQGWVGRLVAASFDRGVPLTAYNLGVRRETSEQVAARWQAETMPRLTDDGDCRVVFSFGVNDTTVEHGQRRLAPERSEAALVGVLAGAQALALTALVVGPAPVDDRRQNERIRSLSSAFALICGRAGVRFVPVVEPLLRSSAWMNEVAESDGAHPAARGYDALADLILAAGWWEWLSLADGAHLPAAHGVAPHNS